LARLHELETENPDTLADLLLKVHQQFHIRILGGCCGTDTSHIECLASKYRAFCSRKPA